MRGNFSSISGGTISKNTPPSTFTFSSATTTKGSYRYRPLGAAGVCEKIQFQTTLNRKVALQMWVCGDFNGWTVTKDGNWIAPDDWETRKATWELVYTDNGTYSLKYLGEIAGNYRIYVYDPTTKQNYWLGASHADLVTPYNAVTKAAVSEPDETETLAAEETGDDAAQKIYDQDTTLMANIQPTPRISRDHYVKPKAEAIKVRAEKGEAYLSFKLNKSDILADFRENATELGKITSTIDLVKNDKDVSITNIDIHGYASPDGPYDNNVRLANNRAAALRNYVCNLYTIDNKLFTYHATPEDWEGFKKKVEASNLADKTAILAVANSSLAPDAKDQKIKKLYPASYRYIMSEIYPRLRHSDYTVTYTVRPFDIEEAKVILKTKPQQLSLQEMYLVAQTYEPGSPEFNEVFDIAVRLFPDDETANLNAACTDLQKGDLVTAEKHLAKAGNSKEAERIRKIYGEMKAEL